jgi:hypothetical protein
LRWKSIFSYYGGKSKIAALYPEPKHGLIIEPFAGAAAYAFRHARRGSGRTAWINDLDSITGSIWQFLLSPDAGEWIRLYWPANVVAGTLVNEIIPPDSPPGILELARSEANQGTQGARSVHNVITSMGAKCWGRTRDKLLEIIPEISHWRFTQRDYRTLRYPLEATWFIDPPYSNPAGDWYRFGTRQMDYAALREWIGGLSGQKIVCENVGAAWLPFQPLDHKRKVGIIGRYHSGGQREAVYIEN